MVGEGAVPNMPKPMRPRPMLPTCFPWIVWTMIAEWGSLWFKCFLEM